MSDGMAKNLEVCQEEWATYRGVVRIQMSRFRHEPKFTRKLHVLFGLLPDAHRFMPRTLSYLALLSILPFLIGFAWWWLL